MSAIFGIIDFAGRPLEDEWIKSMQKDLAHRGPDGQGLYREPSVALGHMLLQVTPESIYDKSPYEEDGFVITAYARLDEREAIMDRLNTPVEERDKITDPLLLLRSFRKFGKDFVKDIYGDFAFAIWHKENKELFCARDQMGVKPFLYYYDDRRFVFSTELKSIVRLVFVKTEVNHFLLLDQALLINDNIIATAWTDIVRLKPSNMVTVSNSNIKFKEYWNPHYKRNKDYRTEEDSAAALLKMLERVIADHTRTLNNIGVPLSGGLDSGTLACLVARKLKKENKTLYTVSSVLDAKNSDPELVDEKDYIEEILNNEANIDAGFIYNTNLSFIKGLDERFKRDYAPVNSYYYLDDAINNYLTHKEIRRVLSGYMGDITTSNRYIKPLPYLLMKGKIKSFYNLFRKIREVQALRSREIWKIEIISPFIPEIIHKLRANKKAAYADLDELPLNTNSILAKEYKQKLLKASNRHYFYSINPRNHIWPFPAEHFDEDFDCGSSNHKVEHTYPLVDRRLVELLLTIPLWHFYAEGQSRGLIRKAMKGILPEKVRKRATKMNYSPGFHSIFKNELKNLRFDKHSILDVKKLTLLNKHLDNYKIFDTFAKNYLKIVELNKYLLFLKSLKH